MNIYIPIATGQTIPQAVRDSIAMQTTPCSVIVCDTEGVVNSNHDIIANGDAQKKMDGEKSSREKCVQMAMLGDNEKYFVMQDRDIVHLHNDNISEAIKKLDENEQIGAVYLATNNGLSSMHLRNACVVMRVEVLPHLEYYRPKGQNCLCHSQVECIQKVGYLVEWLDQKKRIYELTGCVTLATE